MDATKLEGLKKAYRKEKDHRVRARMLAVRMVYARKMSVEETSDILMQSPRWVYDWLERYDQGGLEGLRDLPKRGRPRKIAYHVMDQIITGLKDSGITPVGLQEHIHEKTGTKLHITYVRKIMHRHGLSPKVPQRIHIRRADKKAVYNWRYRLKRRISCLERDDFVIMMQDEAFFIHDSMTGRKYWSRVGNPIGVPYTGSHKKITMYGAIARDWRQFFRTYDKFDSSTFVRYLQEMQKRFGKVTVIADRAPQHHSRMVRDLLRKNRNVKIIYLPKGSPYLNAVEECWHQGKRILLVSEYYKTFLDMRQAVSLYYRTVRFKLDLLKFVNRKSPIFCRNF